MVLSAVTTEGAPGMSGGRNGAEASGGGDRRKGIMCLSARLVHGRNPGPLIEVGGDVERRFMDLAGDEPRSSGSGAYSAPPRDHGRRSADRVRVRRCGRGSPRRVTVINRWGELVPANIAYVLMQEAGCTVLTPLFAGTADGKAAAGTRETVRELVDQQLDQLVATGHLKAKPDRPWEGQVEAVYKLLRRLWCREVENSRGTFTAI